MEQRPDVPVELGPKGRFVSKINVIQDKVLGWGAIDNGERYQWQRDVKVK